MRIYLICKVVSLVGKNKSKAVLKFTIEFFKSNTRFINVAP